jgi:threonine synthase
MDKDGKAKLLRQSIDDNALTGYTELAEELSKIPNLSAVFVPTSSGTCAQGLGEAFKQLNLNPQIHIVQTPACHPIVDGIRATVYGNNEQDTRYKIQDTNNDDDENNDTHQISSLAGAIVDNVAHRKDKVAEIVKNSGGAGWIATDEEIKEVINLVEDTCQVKISPNSALSVVGLKKAIDNGYKFVGPVVCLVTGM